MTKNKSRIHIAACILAALLMVFAASLPAFAEGETARIYASDTEISTDGGDIFIKIDAESGINGGSFNLVYDDALLRYDYYNVYSGNVTFQVNPLTSENTVRVSFASAQPIKTGILMAFHFSSKADYSYSSEMSIEKIRMYDTQNNQRDGKNCVFVCGVVKTLALKSAALDVSGLILGVGETYSLSVLTDPANAALSRTQWRTSSSSVATISSKGLVTAKKEGSCRIFCDVYDTVGNVINLSCDITVYKKPNVAIGSVFAGEGAELSVGLIVENRASDIKSGSFNIRYDNSILKIKEVVTGELLSGYMVTINPTYRENLIRVNFAGQLPLGSGKECVRLVFEALAEGTSEIEAEDVLFYTRNGVEYHANISNGKIEVKNIKTSFSPDNLIAGEYVIKAGFESDIMISGGSAVIDYDSAKFELADCIIPDGGANMYISINKTYGEGKIKVSFASTASMNEAEIAEMHFKPKTSGALSSNISVSYAEFYSDENLKVYPELTTAEFPSEHKHKLTFEGFTWTETETGFTAYADYSCLCGQTESAAATVTTEDKSDIGVIRYIAEIKAEDAPDGTPRSETKDTLMEFTVNFVDHDGSVISAGKYHFGDSVKEPEAPSREQDETYAYTFNGWDKELTSVRGNETYTATYKKAFIEYTVNFADHDGAVISSLTYHYGDTVKVPDDPTREADNTYTYAFNGWDKEVKAVSGNETYTATYKETYIDYTVTFKNYDGSVIKTAKYHYGDAVTVPADPSRSNDNTYSYTFDGWDKQITTVNGNAEYTATYKETYIDYTVKFVDYDDTVLSKRTYHYGDSVTAPDNPTREKDGEYTYTFSGWDKDITQCLGNETYRATYTTDENVYTVTFKNYDGTVISVKTYNYNGTVTEPDQPSRASDNTYYYVFTGWDKEVTAVTDNAEYIAVFEARAHEWDKPTYEWSADHSSVTATRISKNDNTVKQTETANAAVKTTKADCENDGKTVYTASFTNTSFRTQTYEETIPATGHSFKFIDFTWNESEATANYKCDKCDKTASVKAEVSGRTTEPTCEDEGETVYTANVKASDSPDGKSHTDEKKVFIEAKGHTWTFTGFTWIETENGYTAEADYKCNVCKKTKKINAKITLKTNAASCEEAGEIVYTAIVEARDSYDNTEHTETKSVTVSQVGHTWTFTGFTWDNEEATANYKCDKCGNTNAVKASVTKTETSATCSEDGVITYTAKVTAENSLDNTAHEEARTEKGEPAKGHNYGEPEWIWDNEAHTAKAIFVCNDCKDTKEIEAEITTAEQDGVITYTAKVVLDEKTYNDETSEYIEYTIIFKDHDGTTISEKTYHYGDKVTVPDDPEREEDENYTYKFSGWDKEVTDVTGSATYTATYEATEKQQTQFVPGDVNGDGSVNNKDVVALFKHVSGGANKVNEIALDVNGDGVVNNKDVVLLFKYVSGAGVRISDVPYHPTSVSVTAIIPQRKTSLIK